MIICSCNRLSAADVRGCLIGHPPPRSVADVYGRLGCSPKCGTCARTIYGLIAESQAKPPGLVPPPSRATGEGDHA